MVPFADVTFTTEGMVVISGLLATLAGTVGFIFKLLMKAKDDHLTLAIVTAEARLKDAENQKKSYKEIAEEAVAMAEAKLIKRYEAAGRALPRALAPVVPEHSSPVTKEQQETADLQTLRARVTAVTLGLELPPRETGPPEPDNPGPSRSAVTPLPPGPSAETTATVDKLRADVAELKQGQLRVDIAEVKADVADVPGKVADEIDKRGDQP